MAIGYAAPGWPSGPRTLTTSIRLADMMVVREYYGKVGDPGFETDIGELVDMAIPRRSPPTRYPSMMSINLATKIKDPKADGGCHGPAPALPGMARVSTTSDPEGRSPSSR